MMPILFGAADVASSGGAWVSLAGGLGSTGAAIYVVRLFLTERAGAEKRYEDFIAQQRMQYEQFVEQQRRQNEQVIAQLIEVVKSNSDAAREFKDLARTICKAQH